MISLPKEWDGGKDTRRALHYYYYYYSYYTPLIGIFGSVAQGYLGASPCRLSVYFLARNCRGLTGKLFRNLEERLNVYSYRVCTS